MKTLLLLLVIAYTGSAYRCYYCNNANDHDQYFDANCGQDYFNGYAEEYSGGSCVTTVYYDGSQTWRQWVNYPLENGYCMDAGYAVTCSCYGDLCNNRLCQHCFNNTTDWWETTTEWGTNATDWWEPTTNGSVTCGDKIEGMSGIVTSPNYPYYYPPNAECEWYITSDEYTRIIVQFETFSTEWDYDYLQISDGTDGNDTQLLYLSGHYNNVPVVNSTSNNLYIYFYSDYSNQESGFKLNWFAVAGDVTCGDEIEGTMGIVTSPNYPDYYPPNAQCEWYITSPDNTRITLQFESFYSEGNYDYLRISDGNDGNDTQLLYLSGYYNNVPDVTSTSNNLYIYFYSDVNTQDNGFKLNWFAEGAGSGLQCYSCIDCETVDEDTNVEISEDFLSCFIAIELGHDHFVIRGGSTDYYNDGACRHEVDGAIVCYCTTDRCNTEDAMKLLQSNK